MNVKKLRRRENNAIMKKTMVEFVSVEPSVYHCLLILDPPLVMSDGVLVWPYAACLRVQVIHSLWLSQDLAGPHCTAQPAFHQLRVQELFI